MQTWQPGTVLDARVVDPRALTESEWEQIRAVALAELAERLEHRARRDWTRRCEHRRAAEDAWDSAFEGWSSAVRLRLVERAERRAA